MREIMSNLAPSSRRSFFLLQIYVVMFHITDILARKPCGPQQGTRPTHLVQAQGPPNPPS